MAWLARAMHGFLARSQIQIRRSSTLDSESRVDSYTTPLDAELAKVYLESHDIPVRLQGEQIMGAAYALGPMLGGIQLFVDKKDGRKASRLLADYHHKLVYQPEPFREASSDELVKRAWISGLVGFVTIPVVVHVYSVWLLLQVKNATLTPQARKRYIVAWMVNLLAFVLAGWVVMTVSWRAF